MSPKKLLEILLKINAAVVLLAVIPVFMPLSWIAISHEKLGLGPFPSGVIAEYLARSESALYAIIGGLSWLISRDVVRYAPVIAYLAWTGIAFGVIFAAIDAKLGMPIWWTIGEPGCVILLSLMILALQRRAKASAV